MSISAPSRGSRWLTPCIALALSAVTLLVYWPVRHFDFLNWDDLTYVSTNDHVRGGLTWNGFIWSFTHSYSSNWHPLTWLSHMLDCQLYGLHPGGHHLTSLLLHSANASLLFLVLQRLTGARWRSALVAAWFALHPLHVESVAWIAERKDVLSAFFFMLTLWAYYNYVQSPKSKVQSRETEVLGPKSEVQGSRFKVQGSTVSSHPSSIVHPPSSFFYVLALLLFACGLMSKPMLVTLPFVLLLLDYWPLRRLKLPWFEVQGSRFEVRGSELPAPGLPSTLDPRPSTLFRLVLEKLPFLALSAASCIITFLAQKTGGAVATFDMLPLDARLANAVVAYVQYLAKLFWPADLSPIYPHPDHWGPWPVAGAAAALVFLTAAAWRGRRRFPYALTGWLWFLGTLVPMIGIVQVGSQAFADRYTYLPLIGIMVALVWLGADAILDLPLLLWRRGVGRGGRYAGKLPLPLSAIAFVPLSPTLSPRSAGGEREKPPVAVSRCAPNSLASFNSSGRGFAALCSSALKSTLPALLSLALLGTLAWRTREQLAIWKDTGALFGHALALTPNNVQALYGLGAHLVDTGRLDEGKRLLEKAIRLQPAYPEALGTMASTLDGQGKYAEAIRFYQAALKAQPDQAGILNNLAWLMASCPDAAFRNGPEAVRLASRACELTGYAKPLLIGTLAAAQAEAGDFPAAIATAERAAALATALRLEETAAKNRELIQLYRQGQPFHEKKGVE